jgi:hypothetical protein
VKNAVQILTSEHTHKERYENRSRHYEAVLCSTLKAICSTFKLKQSEPNNHSPRFWSDGNSTARSPISVIPGAQGSTEGQQAIETLSMGAMVNV